MNSHTALARLYDYEIHRAEQERIILRLDDGSEHHEELDIVEASAEAEVEVDDVGREDGGGNGGERGEKEDGKSGGVDGERYKRNGSVEITDEEV